MLIVALAAVIAGGCNSFDQIGGGLTRDQYVREANSLCRVDGRDEGIYIERSDDYGERYDTDPDYSYSEYWDDIYALEGERLGTYRRFVREMAALEAPLSIGSSVEKYTRYLRRSAELFEDLETTAGEVLKAARAGTDEGPYLDDYNAAIRKWEKFDQAGFESSAPFIDLMTEKAPACIEALETG